MPAWATWGPPWGQRIDKRYCNDGKQNGTTPAETYGDGERLPACMIGNIWELTDSECSDATPGMYY